MESRRRDVIALTAGIGYFLAFKDPSRGSNYFSKQSRISLTFIFSVFDETQRAEALVFWSPKIHAAGFSALAGPRPVTRSSRCLGKAARRDVISGSMARVWGETLDEL